MLAVPRLVVVAPPEIETLAVPPGIVRIPVFIGASRDGVVESVSVNLFGMSQRSSINLAIKAMDIEALDPEAFAQSCDSSAPGPWQDGLYTEVEMDLSPQRLPEGAEGRIRIVANALLDGRHVTATAFANYRGLRLPLRQGWYAGDCHVHTAWSPDSVILSLERRARSAKENGHGFIVITDHMTNGMRWSGEDGYVSQCNRAQSVTGIPVLPGVEWNSTDGGHLLGYCLRENAAQLPPNETRKELISQATSHNRPHSFSVVAHPHDLFYPWGDWQDRGFGAIELMNRQSKPDEKTILAWFRLLREGLPETIATGRFVAAIGSSDCHNFHQPGNKGLTWLNVPDYSEADRGAVWNGLRRGQASISGNKDLAYFTLQGSPQGSVCRVRAGTLLDFRFFQIPVTGRRCTRITMLGQDGTETLVTSNPKTEEIIWRAPSEPGDTFYVAKFSFCHKRRSRPSEVWTNPIFVSCTSPTG